MRDRRRHRRLSLRRPVTLFVVILVLIVILGVLWHVRLVHDYQKLRQLAAQDAFHWTFIAVGSVLFVAIIALSSVLGGELIGHIRWSRRQSNFIASVSHELNSPLSSIKLFAQTLRQPDLATPDRLEFVETILSDVERLQRLIANILRAAEIDHRGEELAVVLESVELSGYLETVLHELERRHREHGTRIELEGRTDLWVALDRAMFRQVLDNLVDNAVRYRGEGEARIVVRASSVAGEVELRVGDGGVGVSEGDLSKLFDRFYRAERSMARRPNGTGIGLFIVRSIIQAHGGRVWAESPGPDHGTEVVIRLPFLPRADAGREPQLSLDPAPSGSP